MTQDILPAIIESIANSKEIEPDELDFALYEYIDPDAIKQLAAHENASWTLTFAIPNHNVTVTNDGVVLIDGTQKGLWA